jgi:tetratricopeptide (TPR) repeat protein
VDDQVPPIVSDVRTWNRLRPLAPHAEAVARHADSSGIVAPTGRLMSQLALYLTASARYGAAEPLLRRTLAIDEAAYGPDHPSVAIDLNNLAGLLQHTNRLAEAEPLIRRVVAIFEASLGEDHPDVATALNNLALLLHDTGRTAEAEPLFRRALAIGEASLGADHPSVAIDLNNLAGLLQHTNRLAEAEPLNRRALEILLRFTHVTGHEHPDLHVVVDNYRRLLAELVHDDAAIRARLNEIGRPFGLDLGEED